MRSRHRLFRLPLLILIDLLDPQIILRRVLSRLIQVSRHQLAGLRISSERDDLPVDIVCCVVVVPPESKITG